MKEGNFYQRIVDIMQNREKPIQDYTYYWPKDDREEHFNNFVLNTLAKYIQAYDTLHIIKQKLAKNPKQNAVDLLGKLQEKGEQQLAKAIASLIRESAEDTTTVSKISKQLLVLKGNRIITDEVVLDKKVKRLVSILNALQCYIISAANELESRPKEYKQNQLKKYEVDRTSYLGYMTIEMKKIEDYRREALTLRTIISKQHKLPPDSNVDYYCAFIDKVLPEALEAKLVMQQVQTAFKQTQNSEDQVAQMRRHLHQLKQTRFKDVLLNIAGISEISPSPAKLKKVKSVEKYEMPKNQERERCPVNERVLKETIARLRVQNEQQQKQLLQTQLQRQQLKHQLLCYFNLGEKKLSLPISKTNNLKGQSGHNSK